MICWSPTIAPQRRRPSTAWALRIGQTVLESLTLVCRKSFDTVKALYGVGDVGVTGIVQASTSNRLGVTSICQPPLLRTPLRHGAHVWR